MRLFLSILFWSGLLAMGSPCDFPRHHTMWYPYPTPGDVASIYLRVDKRVDVTPTHCDMWGEVLFMDINTTFLFMVKNWLNTTDPNRPRIDMHHWNTFARQYRGGLKLGKGKPPPDPNDMVAPTPVIEPVMTFRIAATTTEGGVYHLPSCSYVTDTAKTILVEDIETYRPCSRCKPEDINALLKEFLPEAILQGETHE